MNKKTISRTIILMVILLLCSAIGTFYYVKLELQEKNGKTNLFSLIPEDCEAIIEVNNIHSLFQNLHYTAFSESYKGLQISDLINLLDKKFNYLDEQKAHGLSGQMNHLLISFHSPESSADQVIYGHLGNEDKSFIESFLKQANTTTIVPKEVKYNGESILIYPITNEEFLACYFQKGFYAISFQKKLIEKVIDTHLHRMPSIQNDSVFALLSTQKKPANSLYLYARSQPLSNWTEFNIRIHNEAIYMAGNCFDDSKDSFAQKMSGGKKVNLIADRLLPEKTLLFYQLAISDGESILPSFREDSVATATPYSFYDFIKDYTQGEISFIEFEGNDTTQVHRILTFPLSQSFTGSESEWISLFRAPSLYKRINGKVYVLSPLQEGAFINKFMFQSKPREEMSLYATLFNQQLLLSNKPDDLVCYLQLLTDQTEEQPLFQKEMTDLSQEPNFTLMTDMEQIFKYPQEYAQYVPSFFFKHKDFFQYFTLSLQLVKATENVNANIILTYKGL